MVFCKNVFAFVSLEIIGLNLIGIKGICCEICCNTTVKVCQSLATAVESPDGLKCRTGADFSMLSGTSKTRLCRILNPVRLPVPPPRLSETKSLKLHHL